MTAERSRSCSGSIEQRLVDLERENEQLRHDVERLTVALTAINAIGATALHVS